MTPRRAARRRGSAAMASSAPSLSWPSGVPAGRPGLAFPYEHALTSYRSLDSPGRVAHDRAGSRRRTGHERGDVDRRHHHADRRGERPRRGDGPREEATMTDRPGGPGADAGDPDGSDDRRPGVADVNLGSGPADDPGTRARRSSTSPVRVVGRHPPEGTPAAGRDQPATSRRADAPLPGPVDDQAARTHGRRERARREAERRERAQATPRPLPSASGRAASGCSSVAAWPSASSRSSRSSTRPPSPTRKHGAVHRPERRRRARRELHQRHAAGRLLRQQRRFRPDLHRWLRQPVPLQLRQQLARRVGREG